MALLTSVPLFCFNRNEIKVILKDYNFNMEKEGGRGSGEGE